MAVIDEANIATTIVIIKRHIEVTGKVPPILDLTAHDPVEFNRSLRNLAIRHLEKAEAFKQKRDALNIGQVQPTRGEHPVCPDDV